MAIDVRLDDESLDFEYDLGIDDNLATDANQIVQGYVTNTKRNKHVDVKARFRGAGYAYNHEFMSTNCNWAGDDCYTARMMPSITSISATGGYMTGG